MRATLLLVMLLSGCVLHSKTPIFSDAEAIPLFGAGEMTFAVSGFKHGQWQAADEPSATARRVGRHYLVPDTGSSEDPATADSYYFIPLDGARLVVQAVAGSEADYAIATWDGKTLLVSPLDCAALKTSLKTNDLVEFVNDSCRLRPSDTAPLAQFSRLAERAGQPKLRFVRQ